MVGQARSTRALVSRHVGARRLPSEHLPADEPAGPDEKDGDEEDVGEEQRRFGDVGLAERVQKPDDERPQHGALDVARATDYHDDQREQEEVVAHGGVGPQDGRPHDAGQSGQRHPRVGRPEC